MFTTVQNFALHFQKLSAFMHHIKISEILVCYMFLHKLKERRQPPNTQQFDLYHPMAHPDTHPISFTYAPVAFLWVVTLHSLFVYSDLPLPCHPPSYWLRLYSSQTFSCINSPTFSNLVILHTYPPMKMGQCVKNVRIWNSDTAELPWRKHATCYTLILRVATVLPDT